MSGNASAGSRKKILLTGKILLSGAIVWVIFRKIDVPLFLSSFSSINFKLYLLANVLVPLSILGRAVRFYLIVNKDERNFGLWTSMVIIYISAALNVIMPAGIGAIAKSYDAYQIAGKQVRRRSASLAEKLIAMV